MNVAEQMKLEKIEKILDALDLSQGNKAMAQAYLFAEKPDDSMLEQAQPENFLRLTTMRHFEVAAAMSVFRDGKNQDMMARFYKLFWAMGKGSACFVLQENRMLQFRREKREWCIDVLGLAAAAAMETHEFTWQSFHLIPNLWLHSLAQSQPEILEQAQALSGTRDDRMAVTAAGILLCHGEDEDLIRRQSRILCEGNVSYLTEAAQCLTEADKQNLAAYIQAGDPTVPVPVITPVNVQGNAVQIINSDAQIIGLAGTASFLGARKDPRARCALRVYARLNTGALLSRLLQAVPQDLLLDALEDLTGAMPGGQARLLLYIASYPVEKELKKLLAEKCRGGLAEAMKRANSEQYIALSNLFPQQIAHAAPDMENRILWAVCEKFPTCQKEMEAFLMDSGDLSDVAEAVKALSANGYAYIVPATRLMSAYRRECGWNGFLCRCAVVTGLLCEGMGLHGIICDERQDFESGLLRMTEALLAWKLPVKELLNILSIIPGYPSADWVKKSVDKAVAQLILRPEHLDGLRIAAKEGRMMARLLAVSALHELSAQPGCAEGARTGLLACTADSAKQVREQLQHILIAHPEWADDYIALLNSKKAAERLLVVGILGRMGPDMRPVLETALAAEKSSKVADAIRNVLGQGAVLPTSRDDLAERVLKGNKIRKIQWLLDSPLPLLRRAVDQAPVSDDLRAALLVAYCELGRIGRSDIAAELAQDIDSRDLIALAHEVYELWLAAGAQPKTKWVLPFAAVFGGPSMTQKLVRAINDWPQHARGAIACDAVNALALSTDPAALLAVDAISRKFKFRQVKTAAAAALENAARELGITAEELADRIVPDLGFSGEGKRIFDYGQRSFTVRLTPTLELEITNHLGKAVKNLPAPGKTDDAEKAAAAYEAFKTMKKQIRTTVTTQKARLEAALSALRCWRSDAWAALFVRNPIMHQFAISLIWGVYEDGKLTDTFRYMEDGSFNTVDEDEYELPAGASIGLVHPVELDDDTLEGWKQQLEDYEITQSIQQLDRPVFGLEETGRTLERFGGKCLNGLSLAGKLMGMGWYRGSVQDGGMYHTFYREDPALGFGVELAFSGAFVGDENETVTVYEAVFYKAGTVKRGSYVYDEPKEADIFSLASIPARYFSEIVYQLERATASSTETNADWKQER